MSYELSKDLKRTARHPKLQEVCSRIQLALSSLPGNLLDQIEMNQRLRYAELVLAASDLGVNHSNHTVVEVAAAAELMQIAFRLHQLTNEKENSILQAFDSTSFKKEPKVIIGDLLICNSLQMVNSIDSYLVQQLLQSYKALAESEYYDGLAKEQAELSEILYLERIYTKMAAYTATCCKIGAYSCNAQQSLLETITSFGYAFGMAYQIRLDFENFLSGYQPELAIDFDQIKQHSEQPDLFAYGWKAFHYYSSKARRLLKCIPETIHIPHLNQLLIDIHFQFSEERNEKHAIH